MIYHNNHLPLKVIGFEESTLTQEIATFVAEQVIGHVSIISPVDFLKLEERRKDNQYLVAFNQDTEMRQSVINLIEQEELNCPSITHQSVIAARNIKIGKGSVVAPFSELALNCEIGDHTVIDSYVLVAHYTKIGNNCHLRPGTMIAGSTTVGNNCMFGLKSGAIEKLTICDNVVVGAFSGVTKDIEEPGVYVGTPARRIRK